MRLATRRGGGVIHGESRNCGHYHHARMRKRWPQILICAIVGFGVNLWLAHHCLFEQWGPGPPWLPMSAQSYWDRYSDDSDKYGSARFEHVSGAVGCDFLIIGAPRPDLPGAAPPRMMITRAGFPLRAFEGMHSWGSVTPAYSWAIPITARHVNVAWLSVIPYRPLPLGIIVNTSVYGLLAWLVIFGPVAAYRGIQRERRRLKQCCHQCGYDLQGDLTRGCPECGWRRTGATK